MITDNEKITFIACNYSDTQQENYGEIEEYNVSFNVTFCVNKVTMKGMSIEPGFYGHWVV